MNRYETHYLTWQYFSLSGIRLTTGTWAFLSFRVSRCPLVFSILLVCSEESGSHLGTACPEHLFERRSEYRILIESPLSPGVYSLRLSNSAL